MNDETVIKLLFDKNSRQPADARAKKGFSCTRGLAMLDGKLFRACQPSNEDIRTPASYSGHKHCRGASYQAYMAMHGLWAALDCQQAMQWWLEELDQALRVVQQDDQLREKDPGRAALSVRGGKERRRTPREGEDDFERRQWVRGGVERRQGTRAGEASPDSSMMMSSATKRLATRALITGVGSAAFSMFYLGVRRQWAPAF